ncbi:MAG: mercuric transporter MerT family protein, partial [Longimicrobiales bacterium]
MREDRKAIGASAGAVAAAVGSALCCAGPIVAVALGVSGAGLAVFEPFRPLFLLAAASLLYGSYLLHREEKAAC